MIRADLWLQFTGLAYGFEAVVEHATINTLHLKMQNHQNAYEAADDLALFEEILAQPQSLKNVEIRILPTEKLTLESHKEFLSLATHRVPHIVKGQTHPLSLMFSEVFASNPSEQIQWSRFVERAFASQRS